MTTINQQRVGHRRDLRAGRAGITLVYKKSGVLNFAHGEVGMFGAFIFYVLSVEQKLPYLVAAAAAVATSAVLGCLTFLLLAHRPGGRVLRPVPHQPPAWPSAWPKRR